MHKPFLKLLSKATLFHPPPPIPPPLNLLFAKNTAILFHFALNPYAVKPESRTDSNHCRRYPENLRFSQNRLLDERRSFYLQPRIDRRFESSPESRGSQTSGVLLVLFVHAKRINPSPFRELPRFCKPRFSALQPQLRTATIKTFQGASRFCKPRFSAPKQQLRTTHFNPFETFRFAESLPLSGQHASACFLLLFALQKAHKKGPATGETFFSQPLNRPSWREAAICRLSAR